MIKLQVIGHLGQDASVNDVNGKKVINFSVAHSEKYKNKEGLDVNKSVWVSCAYWTDRINLALYLKKGTQVYVEGFPEARTYKNNSNETIPQLSLRITSVQLLGSAKASTDTSVDSTTQSQSEFISQPNSFEPINDLPFN